jgi:hypothetical protein
MHNTKRAGISLQMADGCRLNNLSVSNVIMDKVDCAIWIQQWEPPDQDMTKPGTLSNIIISNIQATNTDSIGCIITGLPAFPLKNITLSNIRISFKGGGTKDLVAREMGELPELGNKTYYHQRINNHDQYGMLPVYGFYCRHADDLVMENIDLSYESSDYRPAVYFNDVRDSRLSGLRASYEEGAESLIVIDSSQNIVINECDATKNIGALARILNGSNNIRFTNNNIFSQAKVYISDGTVSKTDVVIK